MIVGSKCRHLKGDELCFTGRASGGHEVREQEEYNRKSNFCNTTLGTVFPVLTAGSHMDGRARPRPGAHMTQPGQLELGGRVALMRRCLRRHSSYLRRNSLTGLSPPASCPVTLMRRYGVVERGTGLSRRPLFNPLQDPFVGHLIADDELVAGQLVGPRLDGADLRRIPRAF
jgi:hypothetical protein